MDLPNSKATTARDPIQALFPPQIEIDVPY
jgi:hypothetical protein